MAELGISLYPEQETMEEMTNYIVTSSQYGFTKIFTSMFSVPGEIEDVKALFTKLCTLAHEHNMEVCIDVNAAMLTKFNATPSDLSVFKEIGVDEMRMDFCYGDERDFDLIHNKENIKIQFSAFMVDILTPIVEKLEDASQVTMCYNFYPQRYTGVSLNDFKQSQIVWRNFKTKIAAFITSNKPNAHGPWPVYDGLPTLEQHRFQPISYQVRDLLSLDVDTIYFGNAFATVEELKEAQQAVESTMILQDEKENEFEKLLKSLIPHAAEKKIVMNLETVEDLNDVEKQILFGYQKHCDLGDSNEYMLRSRVTRTLFKGQSIPHRPCEKKYFEKGDILIVNDNLKQYLGEVQICRSPMENDGQRNLVGHLNEEEFKISEMIKPGDYFAFIN